MNNQINLGDTVLVSEYDYTFEGEVTGFIDGYVIVNESGQDYEVRKSDCAVIKKGDGEAYESVNGGWNQARENYIFG